MFYQKVHVSSLSIQDDPDNVSLHGGDDSDAGQVPEPESDLAAQIPQDKNSKGTQALEGALSGLPPR